MFRTPEQFANANKASIETLLTVANPAFGGAKSIVALNFETARSIFDDTVANAKALLAAKSPQDLTAIQSSLANPTLDKVLSYSRNLYEIACRTHTEVGKAFEAKLAEINDKLADTFDEVAKNSPAGAEKSIAAVRSVDAAANSTSETLNQVVNQVSEIAPANLASAASTADNAVSGASKSQ